ncbi:MAG: serpin family protein [Deltaproteobacteria bacterium]|nr:serpin family protein [Deltaproteobacteria bacterium]
MRIAALLVAAALLACACPSEKDKKMDAKENTLTKKEQPDEAPIADRAEPAAAALPKADAPEGDLAAAAAGNNAFAVDLHRQLLKKKKGNLFFSPYSLSTALAMTYAGARSETATQMAKVMHFTLETDRLHPAMGGLSSEIAARVEKAGNQLQIANRLWGQAGYAFLPAFLELTRALYAAELETVNFADSEKARQTINRWVAGKTADKIKELIAKKALDAETRLVLTNAIYFKGSWARKFKKESTRPRPFFLSASDEVEVPMMVQTERFPYARQGELALLELPYAGDELAMVVLLPQAKDGLAELERNLSADRLAAWMKSMRAQKVEVFLPRFELSSGFSLKKQLPAMGMQLAFSAGADFSGMVNDALFISDVIHQAFVEVNEEGTEAAAATAVIMPRGGKSLEKHPVFRADHPFLFLIRDRKSGQILFMGRVANPLGD